MWTLSIFRNLLYVYLEYQEQYQGLNFRVGAVKSLTFWCKHSAMKNFMSRQLLVTHGICNLDP